MNTSGEKVSERSQGGHQGLAGVRSKIGNTVGQQIFGEGQLKRKKKPLMESSA